MRDDQIHSILPSNNTVPQPTSESISLTTIELITINMSLNVNPDNKLWTLTKNISNLVLLEISKPIKSWLNTPGRMTKQLNGDISHWTSAGPCAPYYCCYFVWHVWILTHHVAVCNHKWHIHTSLILLIWWLKWQVVLRISSYSWLTNKNVTDYWH